LDDPLNLDAGNAAKERGSGAGLAISAMRFFRAWAFCCEKGQSELRNTGKEIPFFLLS